MPNHTSHEHPWFQTALAEGREGSHYRDYYLWADPAPDGGPPNNWLDLGADGFRIDVAHNLLKNPDLPDNPVLDIAARHDVPAGHVRSARSLARLYDMDQDDVVDVYARCAQLRHHEERPPGRAAIVLQLRQLPGTGRDRNDQQSTRDSRETHQDHARVVPHRAPRPRPSSQPRTPAPGSGAKTGSCCTWASKPGCVSAS